MQIYEINALFLCQRSARKRNHILHRRRKQEYFYKRTGNHLSFIVKLERDRHVKGIISGSLSERKQSAVQCLQFVHLIIIRCLKVCRTNCTKIRVILLRYLRAKEQTTVLRHTYQRLADSHVISFFHENTFHVSGNRSGDILSDSRMVLGEGFVADACIFVTLFSLRKILVGYNLVLDKRLHAFVLLLRHFVGDTCTLHRVAVGNVVRRNRDERSTVADAHSFRNLSTERNNSGYRSYGNRFVSLGSQYLSARLNHLLERGRLNGTYLHSGCVGFRFRKNNFITVGFCAFLVTGGCSVAVIAATFAAVGAVVVAFSFMVVTFRRMIMTLCRMIMSLRFVVMLVVCVCDGAITSPQDEQSQDSDKNKFLHK